MSFIKKVVGPDETLIGVISPHWIYGATGIAWLTCMTIFGLALHHYSSGLFDYLFRHNSAFAADRIADIMFWLPTALGGVMFFMYLLQMIAPEIGLTTKRIIYKRGLIFTEMKEVDLEEIKAANVDNGMWGRFLNYGFVVFDARFVQGMDLPAIGKPYLFVKALNEARGQLKQDSMTVVLEGTSESVKEKVAKKVSEDSHKEPPHHIDKMEDSTHAAVHAVMEEASENLRRSMRPKRFKRAGVEKSDQDEAPPKPEKAKPVVFSSGIAAKARELRAKIKKNFSATTAP